MCFFCSSHSRQYRQPISHQLGFQGYLKVLRDFSPIQFATSLTVNTRYIGLRELGESLTVSVSSQSSHVLLLVSCNASCLKHLNYISCLVLSRPNLKCLDSITSCMTRLITLSPTICQLPPSHDKNRRFHRELGLAGIGLHRVRHVFFLLFKYIRPSTQVYPAFQTNRLHLLCSSQQHVFSYNTYSPHCHSSHHYVVRNFFTVRRMSSTYAKRIICCVRLPVYLNHSTQHIVTILLSGQIIQKHVYVHRPNLHISVVQAEHSVVCVRMCVLTRARRSTTYADVPYSYVPSNKACLSV